MLPDSLDTRWVDGANLFFSEEMPDIAEKVLALWGHFATAICVNNLMDAEGNQFGL